MEEDEEIPLILGRPFLAREQASIDVQQGKLTMRVKDEDITFDVFKAIDFPSKVHSCFEMDDLDLGMTKLYRAEISKPPFEVCLFFL